MASQLKGRKVAFLATDGVEQVELTAPWNALKTAGADVCLVSDKSGEIQAVNHDEKGERFHVDLDVSKSSARDFDALVLPGGVRASHGAHGIAAGERFRTSGAQHPSTRSWAGEVRIANQSLCLPFLFRPG